MTHRLHLEPQPIADQWLGRCACGWVATASSWDYATRDETIAALTLAYAEHLQSGEVGKLVNL